MKKMYLLDASGYLYRSYHAIQNMTNSKGQSTNALFGFIRSYLKLVKDFAPTRVVAVFDGPDNIKKRKEIYADYKATREKMPEDLREQIGWAHQFCEIAGIPQLSIPEVEADDAMGSIAKWAKEQGVEVYLCSADKDLCQLVNDHVKMLHTHKENKLLGSEEVEEAFGVKPSQMIDYLALVGDTSDNVPGIAGFGPKTAASLLKSFNSLEEIYTHLDDIKSAKQQKALSENKESAFLSKRLVTIDTEVTIPYEEDFYTLSDPDRSQLKQFFLDMSFHSLIKEQNLGDGEETVHYHIVDDVDGVLKQLQQAKEICFDTETTGLRPLEAECVGIGLGVKSGEAWYIPYREELLEKLKVFFANPQLSFYGHNVKYDLHILANLGITVKNVGFDTILASYLLNAHSRQHSLDALSLDLFGKVKTPIKELIGTGKKQITLCEVAVQQVADYCCEDVDYTYRLKQELEKQLKERKLDSLLYDIELPLLSVLLKMERAGIYIDVKVLKELSMKVTKAASELTDEIYKMAGETFNLSSPKQLSGILFVKMGIKPLKKTTTGFSTNADVLEKLAEEYPIAAKIQQWRILEKLRSTYIDALPNEVNPHTKRIHCSFNQSVTATGRLSATQPNLQNIPIRTELGREIRRAFRPESEGWSFLSADYSQIELRLMAHLSEDPHLINAFQHGEDIHTHTAATVFGLHNGDVTSEQRRFAKAVNFGLMYGQQAFGLSQELGVSMKEAAQFIETYFKQYPKVQAFVERCKEETAKTGKAVTLTGRERLIPEIHSKNPQLRAAAERLAVNTPLQGSSADLIKLAMLKLDRQLTEHYLQAKMILQIHDELIFEVPDEEIDTLTPLVRNAMEGVWQLKVPLIVDIHVGKNWKEC
ncbi:MAG: DNA polymerase I [Chlamydiia bacterium]|nr:DNA polymerase I [Chlamydiia bacterium]